MSRSRVIVLPDTTDVYQSFAESFLGSLRQVQGSGQTLNVILPIGPTAQYPLIAGVINEQGLSLANLRVVLMDEYLDWHGRPLDSNHALSFRRQFVEFLDTIDPKLRLADSHWVIPDPFDIERVDRFIDDHGPIRTCYGGIGVHGHIAFNEPPVSRYGKVSLDDFRNSGTRVVALAPETITINALRGNHGKFADFPTLAVTIGMRHILGAQSIRLYADGGSRQHEALRQFAYQSPDVSYPITLLKDHADVEIVVDQNTGSELT